jgi:hypothetical protein
MDCLLYNIKLTNLNKPTIETNQRNQAISSNPTTQFMKPKQNQSNQDKINNSPTANNHTKQTIQTYSIQFIETFNSLSDSITIKINQQQSKECQPTTHQIKSTQRTLEWSTDLHQFKSMIQIELTI